MKSNLKSKVLSILLVSLMIMIVSTMSFAAEVPTIENTKISTEEKENIVPKLNSKIYFTGKTYKLPNKDSVRRDYGEKEGCGIISIISRNAKHSIYVSGEGWINANQITKIEKYITLEFDKENGLSSTLKINGEFVNVESSNKAVIDYEDGILNIKGNGTTVVNITTKEGEKIEALATVVDGGVTLNIPEKKVTGELSAEAVVADKVKVEANGDATIALDINAEGVSVTGEGNGEVKLTADEKEIVSANGTISASASAGKNGASAEVSGNQTMNLLQRLTVKLTERAKAEVNKEEASASAGGNVTVNDTVIVSGEAGTSYNYQDEDPKADLNAEILGKEIVNVEEQTVPVISLFKKLISKIQAR